MAQSIALTNPTADKFPADKKKGKSGWGSWKTRYSGDPEVLPK